MAISDPFSGGGADQRAASSPLTALFGALAAIRGRAAAVVRALQVARMMSVLAGMSDGQLAAIGITRADIPRHVAKLMAEDGAD